MPTEPVLYEAMYIIDTALEEDQTAEVVSAFEAAVVEAGGEVKNTLPFGRKRLAYEIKGHAEGLYMLTYFETDQQNAVQVLSREAAMIEPIIRFVVCVAKPGAIFTGQVKAPAVEAIVADAAEGAEAPVSEVEGAPEGEAAVEAEAAADTSDAEDTDAEPAVEAEAVVEPEAEAVVEPEAEATVEPEAEVAEDAVSDDAEAADDADEQS